MPAVLAEVAALSNETEARLLATPAYRQRIAESIFAGILGYARHRTEEKGSDDHGK